jgi:hypothetical protein
VPFKRDLIIAFVFLGAPSTIGFHLPNMLLDAWNLLIMCFIDPGKACEQNSYDFVQVPSRLKRRAAQSDHADRERSPERLKQYGRNGFWAG